MNRPLQRVSDTDRGQALVCLEEHLRHGRLREEDFDRRAQQVIAAVSYADIDRVFYDLPEGQSGSSVHWLTPAANHHQPAVPLVQIPDPWDRPIGDRGMTLRKVNKIGWIMAIGASILGTPIADAILPGALIPFAFGLPLATMAVFRQMIAPPKVRYRWVTPEGPV